MQAVARALSDTVGFALSERGQYIRVHVGLFDDGRMARVAAKHGGIAFAYWIAILVEAKEQRNLGRCTIAAVPLARKVFDDDVDRAERVLTALAEVGLAEVACDLGDGCTYTVTVIEWDKWQTLTNAEHAKRSRHKKRDEVRKSVTMTTKTMTATHKAGEQENRNSSCTSSTVHTDGFEFEPVTAEPAADTVAIPMTTVHEVWQHWLTAFKKRAGLDLSSKRVAAIRRAVKSHGVNGAKRCIDGYAADPWRHQSLTRHEIATLFRDSGHIEVGLEMADNPKTIGGHNAQPVRSPRAAAVGAEYDHID